MLVMGMNLKRQRRPSVRLGEVGDVPAASACWFSQETREFLTQMSWEDGFVRTPELGVSPSRGGLIIPGFEDLDRGTRPVSSTDSLQNAESNDPNSSKSDFDSGFGAITWKTRKPRGRSMTGVGAPAAPGGCMQQSPESGSRIGAEFSGRESSGWFGSNVHGECDPHRGNVDSDHGRGTSGVRRWLEERGFGEYANVFEMHEVDEDALPLLTLTDLKEMGVFAVGHRRKLYTAIQQLRCGGT